MAKREVDLVIRARNTANAAVGSLSDLLKELKVAQNEAAKSAGGASGLFDQLGAALNGLNKSAAALEKVSSIAGQFEKAGAAVAKLDNELEQARKEMDATQAAAKKLGDANDQIGRKAEQTKGKLDAERAALAALKDEQSAVNAAVKKAQVELERLAAISDNSKKSNAGLVAQYREQRALLAELGQHQIAVATQYDATTVRLNKLEAAYKGEKEAAIASDKASRQASETAQITAQNFERLAATAAQSRQGYKEIGDALKGAAGSLGLATTESNALAGAQERLAKLVKDTTAALATQKQVAPTAAVGQFQGLAGPGGTVGPAGQAAAAYRNQSVEVQAAAATLANARQTLQGLYQAQAQGVAPTAELTAAILNQRVAVEAADAAFKAEEATLNSMKGVIREQAAARKEAAAAADALAGATRAEAVAEQQSYNVIVAGRKVLIDRNALMGESIGLFGRVRAALAAQSEAQGLANSNIANSITQLKYLALAYIGVYQAAHQVSEIIKVTTDYEAAQVRIAVALGGDTQLGAEAFNHAADAARRLKVDILPAVDAYGLFLSSLKGTKLEGANAVKLFDDILVSIRAFKLGPEAMSRTILALKDMAARGNIARREINQLDQALPVGLFVELGKAAGYSKDNLAAFNKEVHGGKVGLDILIPAFDAVRARAEKGLPQALKTAQSSFADLRNAVLDARLAVGQSGFLDSVADAANKLGATLRSQEGINGLKALGNALAGVTKLLSVFIQHGEATIALIAGLGGAKMLSLIVSFQTLSTVISTVALTAIPALARGLSLITAGFITTAGAGRALTALIGVLTGPVGIAVAVATVAAGFVLWQTHVTDAQGNLTEYNAVLEKVKKAQEDAAKSGAEWAKSIKDLSLTQVESTVRKYREQLDEANKSIDVFGDKLRAQADFTRMVGAANADEFNALAALVQLYRGGSMTADIFSKSLELMNKNLHNEAVKEKAAELARDAADAQGKLGDVSQVATDMGSSMEGLGKSAKTQSGALDILKKSVDNLGSSLDDEGTVPLDKFGEAMDRLKEHIPSLAAELKKLKEAAKIDADLEAALAAARGIADKGDKDSAIGAALSLGEQAKAAASAGDLVKQLQSLGTVVEKSARTITNFEGSMQGKAFWDKDHFRVGFSSDTKTDEQGRVSTVTQSSTSTMAEAVRDLSRRISEALDSIEKDIGSDNFKSLSDEQKAVLSSLVYNFGKLPENIATAIKGGASDKDISALIRNLQPQNGTRRATEAAVFEQTSDPTANQTLKVLKEQEKSQEKQKQNEADVVKQLQEKVDLLNAENKGREESTKQAFIEKTVQEQINAAKDKNVKLTEAQIAPLRAAAAAAYDLKHPLEDHNKLLKEATDLLREINGLNASRKDAEQELKMAMSRGDADAAEAATQKIADLTQKIQEAVPHARELADQLKDPAISANLDKVALSGEKVNLTVTKMAQDINNMLVNGLTNAFNSFFDAVAQGVNPIKALRDAFKQFALDFLKQIANMILKSLLFNLIQSSGIGNFLAGGLGSIGVTAVGAVHSGGIIGSPTPMTRSVPTNVFALANRFHGGGFPGLSPSEVPIIAKKREEMLSEDDPRNALNGGLGLLGGKGGPQSVTVANIFDPADLMDRAFRTTVGQRTFLNWVGDNRSAFKAALG